MSAFMIIYIIALMFLAGCLINGVINAAKERDQNRPYRDIHQFSQKAQKDIDKATKDFIDKMK